MLPWIDQLSLDHFGGKFSIVLKGFICMTRDHLLLYGLSHLHGKTEDVKAWLEFLYVIPNVGRQIDVIVSLTNWNLIGVSEANLLATRNFDWRSGRP